MAGSIASRWKELNGEDYRKNLLDPLDVDLRGNILHYADLTPAAYHRFISDKASKNAGRSRYGRTDFFSNVGLASGNPYQYMVTRFLYASSEIIIPIGEGIVVGSEETNWMRYVAVSSNEAREGLGRRDIVVVWRGTEMTVESIEGFDIYLE